MDFVAFNNLANVEHPIRPWRMGRWRIAREDAEFGLGENIALVGGKALGEAEPGYFVGIAGDYGRHGEEMTKANATLIQHAPIMYETLDSVAKVLTRVAEQLKAENHIAALDVMSAVAWCVDAMDNANPETQP